MRSVIIHSRSNSGGILAALLLVIAIIGIVSKPNESALRNSLVEKYGLIYGAGVIAENLGLLKLRYNDYFIFSTMSGEVGIENRTVAFGFFGKAFVPEPELPKLPAASAVRSGQPEYGSSSGNHNTVLSGPPPDNPTSLASNESSQSRQPKWTNEELQRGLVGAHQVLLQEMSNEAGRSFQNRHPFSRIEECDQPTTNATSQPSFGEETVVVFRCRMRGTITGKNIFNVVVRVRGTISFEKDTFVRRILGAEVLSDARITP
ncbi:MAG TPA: hypothetical protein VFQ43_00550 [Nitrososphaera sp.]|nr:hypothetical protein [Nitrososphaera sp.]